MLIHQSRKRNEHAGNGVLCLVVGLLASVCLAQAAWAQTPPTPGADDVVVFSSDGETGVDFGPIPLEEFSTTRFHLWVDTGDVSSTSRDACNECNACEGTCDACDYCNEGPQDPAFGVPCTAAPGGGNGDELCAIDVQIATAGDVQITNFNENGGLCSENARFASYPSLSGEESADRFRFNVLCGLDPLPAGIHDLGELSVSVGEIEGSDVASVTVSGTIAIGANRQERQVALKLVAIPEPASGLGLWAGTAALAALASVRGRRRAERD